MTRREGMPGIAVLVLVGLGFAAWAVAVKSPVFALRDLRVEGNVRLSAQEVEALIALPEDANVLTLGLGAVARSVETSPWIRSAEVRRELPGTIVVSVRERTPIGWVADPGGGAIVASDGEVLARRAEPKRLAVVGSSPSPLEPGATVTELGEAIHVVAALPPRVRREVAALESTEGDVIVRLRSGTEVMLGRPDAMQDKGAALASILRWAGERGIALATIDVRAPGTPAVRPVTSA